MNRVIVITGGTAGVGRATARRFAKPGISVAVIARGKDGLDATVADIERAGGRGLGIAADVADSAQVEAAAARIEAELGPIDVWINDAMATVVASVEHITPQEFQRVTDVCYHGFVWGTRAALKYMRPRNRGVIIQVGSALAYRSIPLQAAYCGAKHAIHGFTDSLRSELEHQKSAIKLSMVQLPAVNTPQFDWCVNYMDKAVQPVPPIFEPEIIAEVIHHVSLHHRREVYVGWPAIKAIMGNKILPALGDRYLAKAGYQDQLTDEPNTHPPSNLFAPVAGDHGARGRFSERARSHDVVASAATVLGAGGTRVVMLAGAAFVTTGVVLAIRQLLRGEPRKWSAHRCAYSERRTAPRLATEAHDAFHGKRVRMKNRIIDFVFWLVLAGALFFAVHLLGPFYLVADMGNVPVSAEGRAMLEMMCFVAGFSAILVGISHVFSKDFRLEAENMRRSPNKLIERRHERHARVGLLMILGFAFSLAGFVALLLPIDQDQKHISPVLQMAFVVCFGLMTLLTAGGALITTRRQRLFDRRHAHA